MNRWILAVILVPWLLIGPMVAEAGDNAPSVIQSIQWPELAPLQNDRAPDADLLIETVEPTFLYKRDQTGLRQLVVLEVTNLLPEPAAGSLELTLAGKAYKRSYRFHPGMNLVVLPVPAIREPLLLTLRLVCRDALQQRSTYLFEPARQWKVYVVQTSHFDLGYTGTRDKIMEKRDEILDLVLDLITDTDDWPEESRFRWIVEASYTLSHYLKTHPEKEEEVRDRIQEGRIEIGAKLCHMHSSTAGHEEIVRNLYESTVDLSSRLGAEVVTAVHNDVDGITWGSVTAWAGAGVRYFSFNPNYFYRGGNILHDTDAPQAYYWVGPAGDRLLTWRSRWAYGEGAFLLDGLAETESRLPALLQSYENEGYPYDAIHLTRTGEEMWGTMPVADNSIPHIEVCDTARQWNEIYEYPKLICGISSQFFEYLEENFADAIPELEGDCPDWWADGVITGSLAEAEVRRVHHQLVEAEQLASAASILDPGSPYPRDDLRDAWEKTLLFDEHTWGFIFPFLPQHYDIWNEKVSVMQEAEAAGDQITAEALRTIAARVHADGPSLFLYNALSWDRTDVVAWQPPDGFPEEMVGTASFRIQDPAGNDVPYQLSTSHDGTEAIHFIAEGVPANGYSVFRIVPSEDRSDFNHAFSITESFLENEHYRITYDPEAGITGIIDLAQDRELVDGDAPYRLNEFISRRQGLLDLRDEKTTGRIVDASLGEAGPVFASILFEVEDPDTPGCTIRQEVRLYQGLKRIDFINRVDHFFNFLGQSKYFAFGFDVPDFQFKVDIPLAVMEPYFEQLPDFAKYYAVQHWIDVSSSTEDFGVTWATVEAPMVELGEITKQASWANFGSPVDIEYDPGEYPYQPGFPRIYSEIMNNFQNTNFSFLQWGSGTWRYSVTSHEGGWSQPAVTRFGWEHASPLLSLYFENSIPDPFPPSMGFFRVQPETVTVLTVKQAEQQEGFIIRLFENKGEATEVTLQVPLLKKMEAMLMDLAERPIAALEVEEETISLDLEPFGLATVRVNGDLALPPEEGDDDDDDDTSDDDDTDDEDLSSGATAKEDDGGCCGD